MKEKLRTRMVRKREQYHFMLCLFIRCVRKTACRYTNLHTSMSIIKLFALQKMQTGQGVFLRRHISFFISGVFSDGGIIIRSQVWFQCSDKIMNHRSGGRFAGCSSGINLFQHLCIPNRIIHIRPENIKHIRSIFVIDTKVS